MMFEGKKAMAGPPEEVDMPGGYNYKPDEEEQSKGRRGVNAYNFILGRNKSGQLRCDPPEEYPKERGGHWWA